MADALKAIEIVTGSTGDVHVTPIDDAVRNGNVGYAHDKVVFTYYENLRAQAITANEVRVFSGYGMNQGRIFKIDRNRYQSVTIENGSTGFKRADLIVARYTMDSQTGFEDINLVAIRGQSGTSYVDPSYTTGDINNGDMLDDFPLYRVKLNGITIEAVEPLFTPLPDGGRVGQFEKKINTDMKVNLASESSGNLKNCENVSSLDIGVKGTLPINHGGTGQTTAQASFNALAGGAGANTDVPLDSDVVITKTGNTWYQKTFSKIWAYIQAKISSTLGLTSSQYSGNSASAATLSQTLAVNKGGTGKTSIGNNKVLVGNSSGGFDELGIDTAPSSASNNLITSKGVADALGSAGYGDMMKSTYDPNNDGVIAVANGGTGANTVASARNALGLGNTSGALPVANGGTGTTDGTLNGVKLAKSGNSYGYMDGNTFKSFRQPTGDAVAANVLSGKKFANASSDSITGTMGNYSGSNRKSVFPSRGTGTEQLSLAAGYHDSVIVDRTNPYNQGKDDAQSITWTEPLFIEDEGFSAPSGTIHAKAKMSTVNIKSFKYTGGTNGVGVKVTYTNGLTSVVQEFTPTVNTVYTIPSNATFVCFDCSHSNAGNKQATFELTRQAKKLR